MTIVDRLLNNFRKSFPEKNKFRFFIFFVVLSTIFWVITKLSNTYDSKVDLSVNLIDLPVTIVPVLEKDLELKVDLTASGFQLLIYHLFNKKVELSFENASYASGTALINLFDQRFQIEQQLFANATVNQVTPNVLKWAGPEIWVQNTNPPQPPHLPQLTVLSCWAVAASHSCHYPQMYSILCFIYLLRLL